MKAWWLGFPRFRCPHCGVPIVGVKFVGHFKLPKVKKATKDLKVEADTAGTYIKESKREEGRDP